MSTEAAAVRTAASDSVETPTLDIIVEDLAWLILGLVPLLINVYNVDAYRTIQATYSTIFIALAAAAWGISVTLTGRWGEFRKFPLLAPLAGFVLWSLASFAFTTPSMPTSMASWANLILYCVFFVVLSDLGARKPAAIWRLCVPIFVAFSFNVVTGLMQHKAFLFLGTSGQQYSGLYALWPIKIPAAANYFAGLQAPSRLASAAGTLGNQNVLGGYLAATIPLFLSLPVVMLISWQRLTDSLLLRFKGMAEGTANAIVGTGFGLLVISAVASLACLLATDTRGAWLGILAAIGLGLLIAPAFFKDQLARVSRPTWTRIVIGAGVVVVILGGLAFAGGVTPKMLTKKLHDYNTVDQRIVAWQVAAKMADDRPLLGQGLGTYKIHYFRFLAKLYDGKPIPAYMHNRYVQAHNDFIQLAGEEGWPGLIFAVAILVFFWVCVPRYIWRNRPPPSEGLLLMASMLGTFALCVFGVTNFPFHIAASSTVWVAVAAITGASFWRERRTALASGQTAAGPGLPLEARWALSGAISVFAVALIVFTYLPYKADMLTKEGMELYKQGQVGQAGAALKQAIALDPERGDARLVLGIVYAMMNDMKDAADQLIRSQTSYDDVTLHYYLGRVYEAEKDWPKAKAEYVIAQSYFPADTDVGKVVNGRLKALEASLSAGALPAATAAVAAGK